MKRYAFIIGGLFLVLGMYLIASCNSCNPPISNPNVTSGDLPANPSPVPIRTFSVYLENSGSMHGYVKGNTGFEQFLYYYLTQVQYQEVADSISLNYINDRVIPLGNHIEEFIHGIEPEDFVRKGGNTGTSDIAVVLDTILGRYQKDEISMFISDCIVSPGKRAKDIENYLREQRTKIGNTFTDCLKKTDDDLTVVIWQLTSTFDGWFYNKRDERTWYKGDRPFYIWLIGSSRHIKYLLDAVPLEGMADRGADVENAYVLMSGHAPIDYRILLNPKWGNFRPDMRSSSPQTTICNIEREKKGLHKGYFMFSVGANLAGLPLDDDYLLDTLNYELNTKDYGISIKKSPSVSYSHIISLSSRFATKGDIHITLKNRFPQWVVDKTDDVGENLVKDHAEDKTFGLGYLLEGSYDAFKKHPNYAEFRVTIK